MSTYTDIRYDYNLPSGSGGGLTLLSTQTASASASLSFTTGIDSTYRTYLFKFINIHPSATAKFQMNLSTDGGSNYNVVKTTTHFSAFHNEADSGFGLQYEGGRDSAQSTAYASISDNSNTDNDHAISGYLHLFNPSSNVFVKHFIAQTRVNAFWSTDGFIAGYGNTTSAINAINFKFESGNIDAGTIKMYGIA